MLKIDFLKGKKVAVMGLGITGLAVCKSVIQNQGQVIGWDDQEVSRQKAKSQGVDLSDFYDNGFDFRGVDFLVWSPGIPSLYPQKHVLHVKAENAGVEIISDIDLLFMSCPQAQFICITGTNGKSTTTALIHHILKEQGMKVACGGNLGTPVVELESLGQDGYYVLELSSYQIEVSKHLKPSVAILLNITPDHLKHHGTMENYIKAKEKLFDQMGSNGILIVGVDEQETAKVYHTLEKKVSSCQKLYPLSVNTIFPCSIRVRQGYLTDAEESIPVDFDLNKLGHLRGVHNHQNILAAYMACKSIGMDIGDIIRHIHTFEGLPHRQQLVKKVNRIEIVNDSKATNPDASLKALVCYHNIYWLVGGVAKTTDNDELSCFLPLLPHIKRVYLYGESAELYWSWFEEKMDVKKFEKLDHAFMQAVQDVQNELSHEESTILLSPACASFDQFKNFEDRGDYFIRLVEKMANIQKEQGIIYD